MLKYQVLPSLGKGHTHGLQNLSTEIPNPLQKHGAARSRSKAEEAGNKGTYKALLQGFSLRMLATG